MGYHKYNTPGLILSRYDINEADILVDVFTRDLGRITATAQSVRQVDSKLRYNLQLYTIGEFSFVRGKGGWRVVGADEQMNVYYELADAPELLAVFLNTTRIIRQFVAEEYPDSYLFNIFRHGVVFLVDTDISAEDAKLTEQLMVLRILDALGYIRSKEPFVPFVSNTDYDKQILQSFQRTQRSAVQEINHALQRVQR